MRYRMSAVMALIMYVLSCQTPSSLWVEQSRSVGTQLIESPSSGRVFHSMNWHNGVLMIFGGLGPESTALPPALDDGERYDASTKTWSKMSATGQPTARFHHRSVVTKGGIAIWGGQVGLRDFSNDGAFYDVKSDSWSAISSEGAPSPRAGHSLFWNEGRLIVWGGRRMADFYSDGAYWDGRWHALSAPPEVAARSDHVGVWTEKGAWIWGGRSGEANLRDGWHLDASLETWSRLPINNAPRARSNPSWGYDGRYIVLWGGVAQGKRLGSGAIFDTQTWSWLSGDMIDSRVKPRSRHQIAVVKGRVYLSGGLNDENLAEKNSWIYDIGNRKWTEWATGEGFESRPAAQMLETGDGGLAIWGGFFQSAYFNSGMVFYPE